MVAAASAEIRLGDQGPDGVPQFVPECFELFVVRRQVEFPTVAVGVVPVGHGEADESHAWIPVVVGFASGDGTGKSLLSMEPIAGGQDGVSFWPQV